MAPPLGVPCRNLEVPPGEDVEEILYASGFTDGLPVIPPTRRRVRRMLQGTIRAPLEVLGFCPPGYYEVSVERLAVCAVMAGCRPAHFRLVLAAMEAVLDERFNIHGVNATTMGAAPIVIVNGPARHECKVNMQIGVAGSGHRANATVCRAVKLALQNIGRSALGGTESTTIGSPNKYGLCIAEWEERAPAWAPLHVEEHDGDLLPSDSSVTVVSATGSLTQFVDKGFAHADDIIAELGRQMRGALSPGIPYVSDCTLIISPEHYDKFVAGGVTSKSALKQRLMDASMVGFGGKEHPKFSSLNSLHILVAGGPAGKFSAFVPGFGSSPPGVDRVCFPVTRRVEDAVQLPPADATAPDDGTLVDPRDWAEVSVALATRPEIRDGDVIGLVDIGKRKGDEFLDALEAQLQATYPTAKLRRYRKPTMTKPCPADIRERICSDECSFVITALAD